MANPVGAVSNRAIQRVRPKLCEVKVRLPVKMMRRA